MELFKSLILIFKNRGDSNKYSIDYILSLSKLKSKRNVSNSEKTSDSELDSEQESSADENELLIDQNF
jgi:hypothetical protein